MGKKVSQHCLDVAELVLQERHGSAQAKGMQREAFAEYVPAGILGSREKTWRIWRWLKSMMVYYDLGLITYEED